jgi:hypothetical protein
VRGYDGIVRDLLTKATDSKAVIGRWIDEIERLARSDKQVYASYYQQRRAQIRQPDGAPWDALREPIDQALFGEQKEHIRFAALTLDGVGVLNYGNWSIVLRTSMIERRASVFEENTAVFAQRRRVPAAEVGAAVRGYRATWGDRAKLCVTKLARAITPDTTPLDFPGLLIKQGSPGQTEDDDFVEVHVWGPLTIRTVEKVILTSSRATRREACDVRLDALREHLEQMNVKLEVRS